MIPATKLRLNGVEFAMSNFLAGSDAAHHPYKGLPGTNAVPCFIGLQTHTGRVAFRNLRSSCSSRAEPAMVDRVVVSD